MTAAATSDLVNQGRQSINNFQANLPANEYVKVNRPTSSIFDVAVLEILFKRPSGPIMMSIEDFIHVPMDSLSFLSQTIEQDEPTIVVKEDRHPLDWNRLRDSNDDYDEILITPFGRM